MDDQELDAVIQYVCTRRLDHTPFPRVLLDAVYVKRHVGDRVEFQAVVTASGETPDAMREPLGIAVGDSEDRGFWEELLLGLRARGLHGVEVVASGEHGGLLEAMARVLPGARWEREAPSAG